MAESDIIALVVIPCSAKFDILRFVWISKPEFGSLVKAFDNIVQVCQKSRILEVIYTALSVMNIWKNVASLTL